MSRRRTLDAHALAPLGVAGQARESVAPASKKCDSPVWLDGPVLWGACGGDAVILDRIGQALRAHLPEELAKAEASWRERDAACLRAAAHRLAGMVAVASSAVGQVTSDLESEAAEGRLSEAGVLLERLRPMTHAVLCEIDGLSLERLRALIEEGTPA